MIVAVGGFFHESNTFNPLITPESDFIVYVGEEIRQHPEAYLLAGGILDYFATRPQYTVILLVFARAVPNGEVDEAFYRRLKQTFFARLQDTEHVDAFVLALHGSMRVKNVGSAEEDLLADIRKGYPDTPIICGLDMHATLTPGMLRMATAFAGYKTAPHVDAREIGMLAAAMADRHLSGEGELCMAYRKLDYLIAGEKSETDSSPMRELMARARQMEEEADVCAASLLLGFPWAKTEANGVTALVVTLSNPGKARAYADELAHSFETARHRFEFSSPAYPPGQALQLALDESVRPVFLSDSGDNPTAGSTGDNTTLLDLVLRLGPDTVAGKRILMAGIYDPVAFSLCAQSMHKEITLSVGGRFDTMYCTPVVVSGTPVARADGFGPFESGLILLRTAVCDLIITSRHIGFTGVAMFEALGIDYLNSDVIIVKLGYLTGEFKAIAARAYLALTRGCTDEVLERLHEDNRYRLI